MAIDFIPIQLYSPLYYHIILLVVFITFIHTRAERLGSYENRLFLRNFIVLLFAFVLLYMGLRPIRGVFTDMITYAHIFSTYQKGSPITSAEDPAFHIFMYISSKIMSVQLFFFFCTLLYVAPLYIISIKWFKNYAFYSFLFLVCSFSFWAYGVNGIRNGIAGSLFLLGVSMDKRLFQVALIALAIGFHKTMLLPTVGFILANLYNQPKKFMILWFLAIPLSLAAGGFWENFFAGIGFEDARFNNYLTDEIGSGKYTKPGFRWDFLLYSATAVFAGWYYIFKKKFKDKLYCILFNTYLFVNAFWILVIRANFSNRFAYLSWFMIALIIIYPLLKKRMMLYQHTIIGVILLSYFAFTYVMGTILN